MDVAHGVKKEGGRKPRADGLRNRDLLLEVAKAAFAELGPEVSLEEIARRAGVGIGTLYRHFPERGAIVEAVYRREVQQLAQAAPRLLGEMAPLSALHAWMLLFVEYITTKKVIAPALAALAAKNAGLYSAAGPIITDAIGVILRHGTERGEIRPGVEAGDILWALVGFTYGNGSEDWAASARRLIDILIDGLRAQRS